ncbi:hypothetical protein B566_EDAN015935 [Ephemera danica]|nr:hypothetical protein B566_EDAN015935 [Ephemera danica]
MMSEDLLSNKNILRPHLLWSGQKCFRVVGDCTQFSRREMIEERETVDAMDAAPLQFDQDISPLTNSDTKSLTWKILMLDSGVFEARLTISSVYYGFICGTRNLKRLELEKETNTKILLPKSNSNTNEIGKYSLF